MKISTEKTKTMAFCGPEPIRSKIVIDNKIIPQVKYLTALCAHCHMKEKRI
jgi:hypothetical protein